MADGMLMQRNKQVRKEELQELIKKELEALSTKNAQPATEDGLAALIKFLIEQRAKTDAKIQELTNMVKGLQAELDAVYEEGSEGAQREYARAENREIPLSEIDRKIINFAQVNDMVCADDVKKTMGYRGRNAASARLNRLHRDGLLVRFQLGHKVYYKYDAGKTTNTLIVSPPQ